MVEKREEGLLVNLILFVRKPQLGKVKTRLAKDIGDEKALKIYERLLQYTFDVINGLSLKVHVFYADQMDSNDLWHNLAANYYYQEGNDLGERMMNAFKKVFSSSNNPTIIIGSDCPELKKEDVLEAIELLKSNTTVIGPAKDGGYYLLGMTSFYDLFSNIIWSTESVFSSSINKINEAGLSVGVLKEKSDVDFLTDVYQVPWLKEYYDHL